MQNVHARYVKEGLCNKRMQNVHTGYVKESQDFCLGTH